MPRVRLAIAVALVAVLAGCGSEPAQQSTQTAAPVAAPAPAAAAPLSSGPATASASSDLPPLPDVPFPPARPMDVVQTVFRFAAEHPEVLSHIPCFCGCENRGHKHNDDCFVATRDASGRVTAWEPHGIG